jgi:cadmium resistance protein CadD (predicted permease)
MLIAIEAATLAFIALLSTNLDNLLLVLAWPPGKGLKRSAVLFLMTMTVVVVLSWWLSLAIDHSASSVLVWAGFIPLGMGLYELLRRSRGPDNSEDSERQSGAASLVVMLMANSGDTLAVQTALFADLATVVHVPGLLGSILGALILAVLAFIIVNSPGVNRGWLGPVSRARPWLLMIIGILILMDTDFDIV